MDTEIPVWVTFLAKSKTFRLHAILHDSAGSVKSTTKKDLGIVMLQLVSPVHAFWSRDWIIFLLIC